MRIGDWYANTDSEANEYIIRIVEMGEEVDQRDGTYTVFDYFIIHKDKTFEIKEKFPYSKFKNFERIKPQNQLRKLEEFYQKNSGPTPEEKLESFIDEL